MPVSYEVIEYAPQDEELQEGDMSEKPTNIRSRQQETVKVAREASMEAIEERSALLTGLAKDFHGLSQIFVYADESAGTPSTSLGGVGEKGRPLDEEATARQRVEHMATVLEKQEKEKEEKRAAEGSKKKKKFNQFGTQLPGFLQCGC